VRHAALFVTVWVVLAPSLDAQESARALFDLARKQAGDGQTTAALESLRKARALAPNSEEVLSAFARTSLTARMPVQAIDVLRPLTRMCASCVDYHYLLGVALLQAGDSVSASDALRAAEAIDPNRQLTLIALGLALNDRKLFAEAKPVLVRALELQPENVEAIAALSEAEEGLEELDLAESHARRVLATSSTNATAHLVLGMVQTKRGQYAAARDSLLAAVAVESALQKAHYQLSLVYARLNDEANAQKHLELYKRAMQEMQERLRSIRAR
jgi:tetratricopeptide (TPR) repeat protein